MVISVYLVAPGGMGKSTAMKYLAVSWADGTSEELKKFDFVFHISLKHVKDDRSIENVIIAQHNGLKANEVRSEELKIVLKERKVLLLVDGHDEYKPGCNTDIDNTIRKEKLWNCWVIVTSRETEEIRELKQYMDAEVEINGFDIHAVKEFITRFVGNEKDSIELQLEIYQNYGLVFYSWILHIPILLNMFCVLWKYKVKFTKSRTGIIQAMVDRCMKRESIRIRGVKAMKNAEEAFSKLGQLAWQALNEPNIRLIFEKVGQQIYLLFYWGIGIELYEGNNDLVNI